MSGKKSVALSSSQGDRKLSRVEEDKMKIKQEPTEPDSKSPPHSVSNESQVPNDVDDKMKIKQEPTEPDSKPPPHSISNESQVPNDVDDKMKIKLEPTEPDSKPPPHSVSNESQVPDDVDVDDHTSCNLPPPTKKIKQGQNETDSAPPLYPSSSKSMGPKPRPIFDISRDSTPRKAWYWLLAPDGTPATVDSTGDVATAEDVEVAAAATCRTKQERVSPPSSYASVLVSAKRPRMEPGHFHAKDTADDTAMNVDDKIPDPGDHLTLEPTIHGDRFTVDASRRSTQRNGKRRTRELDAIPIESGSEEVDQEFSSNESTVVIDLSSEHEETEELASKVSTEVIDLSNEDEENDNDSQQVSKTDSVNESMSALPSRKETRTVYLMCRENQWDRVLESIESNHLIATASLRTGINRRTTILHEAIQSRGDAKKRIKVIQEILHINPRAASITNSMASLPIHAISQRNVKMDSNAREILIRNLIHAYPESLIHQGGPTMRTPLHIIVTATMLSAEVRATMIQYGRQACFIRDTTGFLPVHLACSRHCSLENLKMLLEANPASLFVKTNDGRTLLDLAKATATKKQPNYGLIAEIERRIKIASSTTT